MKTFIVATFAALMFFAFEMAIPKSSEAGYNDPWYACYVVSGGTLQKCIGPFKDQWTCRSYQWKIPFGSRWTGCKQ